jgi:molybdopterin-guanine dinucleotide biosynthesis adapter protein
MKYIGISGWSGAGKTTLLLKLIPALKARGFSVSTLKHAHHAFDVDTPGKDSYEHRKAGANEVLVSSGVRFALMGDYAAGEPPLNDLLKRLAPVDLVLVEGFKKDNHPKIIIERQANNKPCLWIDTPNVKAVIADFDTGFTGETAGLDDINRAIELILKNAVHV